VEIEEEWYMYTVHFVIAHLPYCTYRGFETVLPAVLASLRFDGLFLSLLSPTDH